MKPEPQSVEVVRRGDSLIKYAVYDIPKHLSSNNVLNLDLKYNGYMEYTAPTPPVLTAQRFQTGIKPFILLRRPISWKSSHYTIF